MYKGRKQWCHWIQLQMVASLFLFLSSFYKRLWLSSTICAVASGLSPFLTNHVIGSFIPSSSSSRFVNVLLHISFDNLTDIIRQRPFYSSATRCYYLHNKTSWIFTLNHVCHSIQHDKCVLLNLIKKILEFCTEVLKQNSGYLIKNSDSI